jgi:hypothetical protein
MLSVPGCKLRVRDVDQFMSCGSVIEHKDFLSNLVTTIFRQYIDPNPVVNPTRHKTVLVVSEEKDGGFIYTHIAIPTTQYVAYQKLTFPPYLPVSGGTQGITKSKIWINIQKITGTCHALNSGGSALIRLRRRRMKYKPHAMKRKKTASGYDFRSTTRFHC